MKNLVSHKETVCTSAIETQACIAADEDWPERDRHVSLAMDAMSLKAGVVYRSDGSIIGICEEDDTMNPVRNTQSSLLQQQLGGASAPEDEKVAQSLKYCRHFLVFYATGLGGHKFAIPAARYCVAALNAKNQTDYFLEVTTALYALGLFLVIALSYDGAGENRGMVADLLAAGLPARQFATPAVCNLFAGMEWMLDFPVAIEHPVIGDLSYVFFIPDPPHKIKTVRNATCGSRDLTRNGDPLKLGLLHDLWKHVSAFSGSSAPVQVPRSLLSIALELVIPSSTLGHAAANAQLETIMKKRKDANA